MTTEAQLVEILAAPVVQELAAQGLSALGQLKQWVTAGPMVIGVVQVQDGTVRCVPFTAVRYVDWTRRPTAPQVLTEAAAVAEDEGEVGDA